MGVKYDFSGYATKNDLKCSDGRTIRKDAFKDCDGITVPIVWQHQHNDIDNVLGHALLENREDGVYCYGSFNESEEGKQAKIRVNNGDIKHLSIYANQLKQDHGNVLHGVIREVSLVLAGANPGALIDYPILAHSGEEIEDEAIIYLSDDDSISLSHEDDESKKPKEDEEMAEEKKEAPQEEKKEESKEESKETVKDIFETLNEKQKKVVYYMIGQALEEQKAGKDDEEDEEDEGEDMKHNVFDNEQQYGPVLSHADIATIFNDAKKMGSLKDAVEYHQEEGVLAHSTITPIPMDGMEGPSRATAEQTYGVRDLNMLFPEYKSLNNPPEFIQRDMNWVSVVMSGVHHTPFSRIKSVYANITEDDARARGYIKGKQKKEEIFTLLKRKTDPQTVYKKQKLDRDDIIDITDFDTVAWIKSEMRTMLDEELARAFLIGDGRASDSDDKINEQNIRPIATDVDLFNIKVDVQTPANSKPGVKAKAFIDEVIRNRKYYKGSGNPTMFTTADMLTEMLLLEDGINHKLYKSTAELATALRVSNIVEVEVMEGQKIGGKDLAAIIVNLNDYNVGADKGGAINMFDDFDIDYNQYKYLIETRCSGALIKPFSAMTVTLSDAQ